MKNPFEVYTSLNNDRKNRKQLDWEESALDSQKKVEGFFDEDRPLPNLYWLSMIIVICFLIIGFRLFNLQIVQGSQFHTLSVNNRIRKQTVLAPRGLIEDRNGAVVVQNTASFNLVAVPYDLPKVGLESEIHLLAQNFNLNEQTIDSVLSQINHLSFQPIVIAQNMTQDESILFQTNASKYFGFSMQQVPIRQYLDPLPFSHVLGYAGLLSAEEQAHVDPAVYDQNDFIGKSGIEQQYEQYLHGQNGDNLVAVDAAGHVLNTLGQNSPIAGDTLVLNIDQGLQDNLYHQLADNFPTRKAAAVALDPRNGQVLALVSVPGYNDNLFAAGISTSDYASLLNDANLPLFNRAIAGLYPPGSTVKPMVATAGLQQGVITPSTIIRDNGDLVVPNQYNPSVKYQFHGWKAGGLGLLNVEQAIALSSDIFFYEVAGGNATTNITGLGAEKLAEYYRKFGLGEPTGIDLPGEKGGVVPSPEWKAQYYKNDPTLSQWYLGDTYHEGIGQGDLLVTPLQDAEWTAVVANGGIGYEPQVVSHVIDQNGKTVFQNKPHVLLSDIAPESVFKIVQQGMRQTVLSGTAKPLQKLSISSAGKTGTSQFDGSDPNKTHAWFSAYAPYENPQIVITVLVEAGGEGNAVSEPIVQNALQWWATNRYNK